MNKIFEDKALMERLQRLSVDSIAALGAENQVNATIEELEELHLELKRFLNPNKFYQFHAKARKEQCRIAAIQEMADVVQTLFHCWNVLVKDVFDEQIFLNKLNANIVKVHGLINKKIVKDGE